jgi:hypothetical protein
VAKHFKTARGFRKSMQNRLPALKYYELTTKKKIKKTLKKGTVSKESSEAETATTLLEENCTVQYNSLIHVIGNRLFFLVTSHMYRMEQATCKHV